MKAFIKANRKSEYTIKNPYKLASAREIYNLHLWITENEDKIQYDPSINASPADTVGMDEGEEDYEE